MADLFLSHSTKNKAVALEVEMALKAAGHRVFVDSDHDDGIAPAKEWRGVLFSEIRLCHAVVFLNSVESQGSMWCFTELALATERSKPIYAVNLTAEVAPHPLLMAVQAIRLESDVAGSLKWLCNQLERDFGGRNRRFTFDRTREPYPGLRSFEAADAGAFFGRDDAVNQVLDRIDPSITSQDGDLITVIGPSGCGKSSLIKAGVLPRLVDRAGWLVVGPFEPGNYATDRLVAALRTAATAGPDVALDGAALERDGLPKVASRMLDAAANQRRVLLVIDQFEYLGTADPIERDRFLQLLDATIGPGTRVTLLLIIRQDRLDEVQRFAPIGRRITEPLVIAPIDRDGLALAIEEPAALVDMTIGPGLTSAVIDDATTGGADPGRALPLIAATLQQVYESAKHDNKTEMTISQYVAVGRVTGAIQRNAEQAEARLGATGPALDELLLRFVTLSDERPAIGRPLALSQLNETDRGLVTKLEDARLLTGDGDSARLVHDRLIEAWPRLHKAVDDRREELLFRSRLESGAKQWSKGDGTELLLGTDATKRAVGFMKSEERQEIDPVVRQYVNASRAQIRRRRGLRVAALLAIVSLAAVSVWKSVDSSRRATAQHADAFSGRAVAALNGGDSVSALRDALQSLDAKPTAAAQDVLADALSRPPRRDLVGAKGAVEALAFAPDGKTVAAVGRDELLRWDLSSGRLLPSLWRGRGPLGQVSALAFAPDSKTLVTGIVGNSRLGADCESGCVVLWNLTTASPRVLKGNYGEVSGLAVSSDGRSLVATVTDGVVSWDLASGEAALLASVPDTIGAASSSSGLFAVGGVDEVQIWNPTSDAGLLSLPRSEDSAGGVAFSPDRRTVASAGSVGIRLWSVASPGQPRFLPGNVGEAFGVAFSADGRTLATRTAEGVLAWDLATLDGPPVLQGRLGATGGVAFSARDNTLGAGGPKGVMLWDLAKQNRRRTLKGGRTVGGVAFSSDSGRLAAAGDHGRLLVWNVNTDNGPRILASRLGPGEVKGVTFSADGKSLASFGESGFYLWDLEKGGEPRAIGPPGAAHNAVFSPQGSALAAVIGNRVVVWDRGPLSGAWRALPGAGVVALTFSPDGRSLAGAGARGVWVWSTGARRPPRLLASEAATSVAFAPSGLELAAVVGGSVHVWDLASNQRSHVLKGAVDTGAGVVFSADGRSVVVADGGGIRVWDRQRGSARWTLQPQAGRLGALEIAPDGRTVAAVDDFGNVVLWPSSFLQSLGDLRSEAERRIRA